MKISAWKRFKDDKSGLALIYVTIALPVLIGFGLLAIDVGRLSTLQSSLQNGADALALAGAAELDRRPDSITRAERAITNLIADASNQSIFASTLVNINEGATIPRRYLKSLPTNDATAITSTNEVSSDPVVAAREARFVEVNVIPLRLDTIFPATFVGAASNIAMSSATAVAGFGAAVCNFTPLFMCNPFEPTTGTTDALTDYGLFTSIASVANRRRLIAFKSHDPASQWTPGNFGFLQAEGGPGAHTLGESIAEPNSRTCFLLEGLNTQTGNMTTLMNAFNTRFDLYAGAYGNAAAKASYPPAANVRKGYIVKKTSGGGAPNACDHNNPISEFFPTAGTATYENAMGFPRDSCFPDSCTLSGGRMGNGDWGGDTASDPAIPDFEQYWQTNFGWDGIARPTDPSGTQYSNTNLPTRYDIYRWEIANNGVDTGTDHDSSGYTPTPPGTVTFRENGTPACNAGAGIDTPDRRIIYGALINCRAVGMTGGSGGGPYDAVAFGKFFMTEPMGVPPDSTLYTELIDVVQPGQLNSVARDIVQLYR